MKLLRTFLFHRFADRVYLETSEHIWCIYINGYFRSDSHSSESVCLPLFYFFLGLFAEHSQLQRVIILAARVKV